MEQGTREERFKEALKEVQQMMYYQLTGRKLMSDEDELDLFDRLIDNWHLPTVRAYNRMAPNSTYDYIRSQYEDSKLRPDNTVSLLVALPNHYWTLDKDELWMNRVKYNEGRNEE